MSIFIYKLIMKNFIQKKVRLMLEGISRYSTKEDLEKLRYALVDYHNKFSDEPYFMSDSEGDAIIRVSINQKGIVASASTPKAAAHIAKTNLGLVATTKDYMVFQVMAGRGVEHPGTYKDRDQAAVTRRGKVEYDIEEVEIAPGISLEYKVAKPGSPASDAVIKVFMNHGKDILDFVRKNMEGYDAYTDDNSAEKLASDKNSPELADKVQGKMDLLNKQSMRAKTTDSELSDLRAKRDVLVKNKLSARGDERKAISREQKRIEKQIAKMEKELSYKNI